MYQLSESLEYGDLKRVIHKELHIDEYKSKMGDDGDICVISFKVSGKEPATDLINFIEKGYDWVLDADVSAGEKEDGDYLVFVELERTVAVPEQILELMTTIVNLTTDPIEDWRVRYYKSVSDIPLELNQLIKIIPTNANAYNKKYNKDLDTDDIETEKNTRELDKLKSAAGIDVSTKAPSNSHTDSLRIAAGLK